MLTHLREDRPFALEQPPDKIVFTKGLEIGMDFDDYRVVIPR